eukprot:4217423-Prymnesium_polylepis.1
MSAKGHRSAALLTKHVEGLTKAIVGMCGVHGRCGAAEEERAGQSGEARVWRRRRGRRAAYQPALPPRWSHSRDAPKTTPKRLRLLLQTPGGPSREARARVGYARPLHVTADHATPGRPPSSKWFAGCIWLPSKPCRLPRSARKCWTATPWPRWASRRASRWHSPASLARVAAKKSMSSCAVSKRKRSRRASKSGWVGTKQRA